MKSYANNNPRFITAKFPGHCAETGKPIKKGDQVLYFPLTRKVYCGESHEAQVFAVAEFDRTCLGYEY